MAELRAPGESVPDLAQTVQLQLVFDQLKRSPYALVVIDGVIAWLLIRTGIETGVYGWVLGSAAVQFCRAFHVRRLARSEAPPGRTKMRVVLAWFFAAGLTRVWPIAVAFEQGHGDIQFMVTSIMLGMMAGGVGTAAGLVWAYVAWATPVVVALLLGWLSVGTLEGRLLGGLLCLMSLLLTINVRSYGRALGQLHRAVLRANDERDRAEAERARANEAWHRAESAVRAKTRFFAAASHDLRQPLGVLRWYGDAVRVHAAQLGHEPLMAIGEGIGRALERAEPLVQKYLDIARIEAGALELSLAPVNVAMLFERVREAFAQAARERGLYLDVALEAAADQLTVYTDESVLRSIVDNLVGNAIKFTATGGITLSAGLVPGERGQMVCITVKDTGIGIEASEHERVFEDFYQIGNQQRASSKGMGLGLSIARRQAHLLDTEVRLRSELGKGASFALCLPAQAAVTGHVAGTASRWPGSGARKLTVLVIDDEPEIRLALRLMLEAVEWRVYTAAGLDDALHQLGQGIQVDALVVDHRLSNQQTGVEVIGELKACGHDLPAVLVTGDTSPEQLTQLGQSGLPVLHKPVQCERLLDAIFEAVGQGASHHEAR